jgi:hypothetical protein
MFVHVEKGTQKNLRLAQFYQRENLQPCKMFKMQRTNRNPTEYDMLEMIYVTRGQFDKLERDAKNQGILQDYGVSIPLGEK